MQKKSFTLVEMLIVIVIIGLLAVALIPKILGAQQRARDTARIADTRQIGTALQSYIYTNNTIPSSPGTGYKDISSISGQLLEYLKSIPEDKGHGLMVNSDGDYISSGDNYAYYVDGNKAIVTAAMEGGKGNSPTCSGITGPKNVFGKHSDGYGLEIGSYSKTMSFDGVDDYVAIASNNSIMDGEKETISIRMKGTDINQGYILGSQPSIGSAYRKRFFHNNFQLIHSASDTSISYIKNIFDGNWNNIVYKRNDRILSIYINGILTNTKNITNNTAIEPMKSIWIGRLCSGTCANTMYYSGSLSNIRIYNRDLSSSEIKQLYQKSDIRDGLVAHYKLDETEGTVIHDSSGNGYHGVLKNMSEEDMQKDSDYVLVN